MTLYILDHRHRIDNEYYDTKFIGVYSSYSTVLQTVKKYSQRPGFCDFKADFHVELTQVRLTVKEKERKIVYLLIKTQVLGDDEITVSYNAFSNYLVARLSWIVKTLAFCWKKSQKFYLEKHRLNKDNWAEGFVIIE